MISTFDFPGTAQELPEQLVNALRMELAEYGGLLALFDAQQKAIIDRQPDRTLELGAQIERQAQATRIRRKQRESFVEAIALTTGHPEAKVLRELVPYFPPSMRPMVEALTDEVNRLITDTRRRARQNQMLLARAMEITGELVARLSPETVTKTYSARGELKMNHTARAPRLVDHS
jgi:flagellar biosynthesis/type III secretory pathway chaperone